MCMPSRRKQREGRETQEREKGEETSGARGFSSGGGGILLATVLVLLPHRCRCTHGAISVHACSHLPLHACSHQSPATGVRFKESAVIPTPK
jgi:hypothetical protein